MVNALKCGVQVMAGVIPNEPMIEFTRQWNFTSQNINDEKTYKDGIARAMEYAKALQDPTKFNWVTLNWIWF